MTELTKTHVFNLNGKTTRPEGSGVELSVVIVSYNVKEFLEQALVSVGKALVSMPSEVIVVDNASSDDSTSFIKERFPEVRLISNPENLGFARASNQGMKAAGGNFVALLNPDTLVQEDTFMAILNFFQEHREAGMVGCKILNPDGSLQLACRRSFPTPWVAFTRLSGLSHLFAKSRLFGKYNLTYQDPDKMCEVDAISGSFMVVRRQTVEEVGLLDESFFMYGEDLDWCYRIGKQGWKVLYFPGTQIVHFKGESSKKAQFDSFKLFYQAMGLFAAKHFKRRYFLFPYWILLLGIWSRAVTSFLVRLLPALAMPALDLSLLLGSLILAIYLRFDGLVEISSFKIVISAYSATWLTMLLLVGCYDRKKFFFWTAAAAISAGFLVNASLTFFFKQYAFSRAVVLYGSVIALLVVPGSRLLAKWLASMGVPPFKQAIGKKLLARKTIIVGDGNSGARLIQKLNSRPDSGYDITGIISLEETESGESVGGVPVLGSIANLNAMIHALHIQEVIFSTHTLSYDQILGIIANSGNQSVNFKLSPSEMDVIIGKASIDRIDDMPLLEIDYKLHRRRHQMMKRLFDLLLSGLALLPAVPIFFVYRWFVRAELHRGAFFLHDRPIGIWVFKHPHSLRWPQLPLLWSVFKGDMSLVGPEIQRSAPPDDLTARNMLELKPGLTGIVQVNFFKQLTPADKQKYEIYYLKNYSPFLDLEILWRAIFSSRNKP